MWQRWMRRPQSTWVRKALFQVHLWTGIIIGVYVVVVCVSGSAVVFRNDLYDKFEEWGHAGPTPMQTAIMHPGYIALRWLSDLHGRLLLGSDGMWYNAIGGFITAVLCITGLVIWWPGRAKWKRALGVQRGVGWKRFNFDLHSSVGFWTFLILFVWGMTGGYFVFPEPFRAVINTFAPINPPLPSAQAASQTSAQAAKQTTPQTGGASVNPRPGTQPAAPRTAAAPGTAPAAGTAPAPGSASFSASAAAPSNGPIILRRRRRPLTTGGKILQWFSFLHYGNFGGWPLKVLYVILGLAPALLFGTALIMWWNRVLAPMSRRWKRGWEESPHGWEESPQGWEESPQVAEVPSGEMGD
jgi:uncharacterized iron-regulated membrane protein